MFKLYFGIILPGICIQTTENLGRKQKNHRTNDSSENVTNGISL